MDVFKMKDMVRGWFAGDFEPTAFKTKDFEACYRVHPKGEIWEKHYHKEAVEINYLVSGRMTILGEELTTGDIFVIHPDEVADPEFLEDCAVICIKTPSVIGDKYVVE